jgi:hypothetical protein
MPTTLQVVIVLDSTGKFVSARPYRSLRHANAAIALYNGEGYFAYLQPNTPVGK